MKTKGLSSITKIVKRTAFLFGGLAMSGAVTDMLMLHTPFSAGLLNSLDCAFVLTTVGTILIIIDELK